MGGNKGFKGGGGEAANTPRPSNNTFNKFLNRISSCLHFFASDRN